MQQKSADLLSDFSVLTERFLYRIIGNGKMRFLNPIPIMINGKNERVECIELNTSEDILLHIIGGEIIELFRTGAERMIFLSIILYEIKDGNVEIIS